MQQKSPRVLAVKAAIAGVALLLLAPHTQADEAGVAAPNSPLPARPGAFSLKIEPGIAFSLTDPQSDIFEIGGGETLKAFWSLNRYVDVGPSVTVLALPAKASLSDAGTAWTYGGSVRFKRPHDLPDNDKYRAVSPWVDADALYVRTGDLNRPGLALAAGLSVPIGKSRAFWIGPFVRYLHIIQGERSGFDNHDAKILSVGISLEVGSGLERKPEAVAESQTINNTIYTCPDRDKDGVPDTVDRCPDVIGPMETWGCPAYKKLVVKRDKLELKEKLYFGWDQATLQDESFEVLDEVVQALKDNRGFRVQVEGHTSSEGGDDHNQTLSEARAAAVLDYLALHGIGKDRLISKGFASSVPIDTNATIAGRENNRRVEFVVHFIILNDGSK